MGASFRVLSFARFNERVLFSAILKTEGFYNYQLLSKTSFDFLGLLYKSVFTE